MLLKNILLRDTTHTPPPPPRSARKTTFLYGHLGPHPATKVDDILTVSPFNRQIIQFEFSPKCVKIIQI